jgi:hypothetical protein
MKRTNGIFASLIFAGGLAILAACSLPVQPGTDQLSPAMIDKYPTISALLTETNRVQTLDIAFLNTTETPIVTPSPLIGTITPEQNYIPSGKKENSGVTTPTAVDLPCNLAQAGKPLDITIPDDSRLKPGEYFSKTWRIVNAGSCVWNQGYAVVWFSGDQLGVSTSQGFNFDIEPGHQVDVTVEMTAPLNPGAYQTNWKIRDNKGNLFGIGPQGNSPLWARIQVVPVDTPTVTPLLPAATETPVIYASGALILPAGQKMDLDSGLTDQAEMDDFSWEILDDGSFALSALNGAKFILYGTNVPTMENCFSVELSDAPVYLNQMEAGKYLCYQTEQGLPGRIYLKNFSIPDNQLDMEFLTWFVP